MKDPKKYTKIELGFSKLSRALISLEDIVFKPVLEYDNGKYFNI